MVQNQNDDDDSQHNAAFISGNVHLITTKEDWEEKLAEASREGKIVSFQSIFILIWYRWYPSHTLFTHALARHADAQMGIRLYSYYKFVWRNCWFTIAV